MDCSQENSSFSLQLLPSHCFPVLQHGFFHGLQSPRGCACSTVACLLLRLWHFLRCLSFCFLLLSLSNMSAFSLGMFSQLHHQTGQWAQLWPVVSPLPSHLEPAVPGTGQPLSSSHRGHPGSPLTTKTLPPTSNTDFKSAKHVKLSLIIDISGFLHRLFCVCLTVLAFYLISSVL